MTSPFARKERALFRDCRTTKRFLELMLQLAKQIEANKTGFRWFAQMRDTTGRAAYAGHLEYLKYALENGAEWYPETTAVAARFGHLEFLKYLRTTDCLSLVKLY
uniref:Uncharacterized protein n=1 Tax=Cacopsylla melanoneura TaxID=428564 RepID=A0A8D8Z0D7_9HEMI